MNPFKKSFWELGQKEKRSLIHFVILIVIIILVPIILENVFSKGVFESDHLGIQDWQLDSTKILDSSGLIFPKGNNETALFSKSTHSSDFNKNLENEKKFQFDPNSNNLEVWKKTGLPDYKIKMILHYLEKGGHFNQKEDLKKIYCINNIDFIQLESHIQIPNRNYHLKHNLKFPSDNENHVKIFSRFLKSSVQLHKVNINEAEFLEFRNSLGLSTPEIYDILNFRKINGLFSDIRELKNLHILNLSTYNKVEKFLTLRNDIYDK